MPKNPVAEFRDFRQQQSATRKDRETEMVERWKGAPEHEKPQHLQPLLQAYDPVFNRKVNEWSRGARAVNPAAMKAELQKQFINSLHTYDPTKAALSTHVETRLQKAKRFVGTHQNLAYIPEGQARYIGPIMKARDELTEEFGREPTHSEVADHLGITPARVERLAKSLKKDIPASMLVNDPSAQASSREREVLDLLQFNLSAEEKKVFDYLYGRNGMPVVQSTNDLAAKLGKSAPQISRLKTSILKKYKQYA
jgi:DNA-directed RNA polymerase specialized sigma subunit